MSQGIDGAWKGTWNCSQRQPLSSSLLSPEEDGLCQTVSLQNPLQNLVLEVSAPGMSEVSVGQIVPSPPVSGLEPVTV